MEKILARLSPKLQSSGSKPSVNQEILTKLSEQQLLLEKQKNILADNGATPRLEANESLNASPRPPAADSLPVSASVNSAQYGLPGMEASELHRLKQELFAANSRIALQEKELAQTRVMKHTFDQALGPPFEADFGGREVSDQTISHLQNIFNASSRPVNHFQDPWNGQDDSQSDISDALSAGAYNRARGFWVSPNKPAFGSNTSGLNNEKGYGEAFPLPNSYVGQDSSKFWGSTAANGFSKQGTFQSQRVISGPSSGACGFDSQFSGEQARYLQGPGLGPGRPLAQTNRDGTCFPAQNPPWGTFGTGLPGNPTPRSPGNRPCSTYRQVGLYPIPPYQGRPVGTPLSPTATEFTSINSNVPSWTNSSVSSTQICFLYLCSCQ